MDREALRIGIALRRAEMQHIETEIVLAYERAASRGWHRRQVPADRSAWDRPTWDRYLAEATRLELTLGQRLRRLYREIETLERLAALPRAA